MSDHVAAREAINEARACIWNAVKIDAGRRALEGDIESADIGLETAREALDQDYSAWARSEVVEALELLRTPESHLIAEDTGALDDAIRILETIRWD